MSRASGGGGLLRVAVERPVTVLVTALLVVLFGALSVADLPIQLTPDVSVPTLTVRTAWPGAAPSEIEAEILEQQEEALKDVPGLVAMTAEARTGQGTVTLELTVGTDIDDALVRVSNRLTQVGNYPEAANDPVVQTADSTGPPLAVIAVRSPRGDPVAGYRTWLEDRVLPELLRIEGVGDVRLIGGRDRVVAVDFDPRALASRNLRVGQLVVRVRSELRAISGGEVTLGRRRLQVRTMAVDATPEQLEAIVIGAGPDGTPIRLGDVGRASISLRDAPGVAMSDDRPSLVMLLSREAGSNVLEVTERIRETVTRLDRDVFAPESLRIEVISDQVDYIRGALSLVQQNLLIGAALAALALLIFLRSFGSSAIVSVSIPVCVFGTLLGMTLLGRSINVVSLAGITFAIGMVLDNSIVSLESIDTWRSRVGDAKEAAFQGVREVWGALLASTATTAAVFVPVIAWEGEVGQLLRDVAVAVSFAILTSLWVSTWVIPSLATRLRPKPPSVGRGLAVRARGAVGAMARKLSGSIVGSAAVVLLAVGVSVGLSVALLPPLEYLPSGNRNLLFGILTPPPGTSVEELDRVARQVQTRIARETGRDGVPAIDRSFFVGSPDRLFAGAVARDPSQVRELLGWLRGVQGAIPGFFSFTNQASLFGRIGGGRAIEVNLTGADLQQLAGVGGRMMGAVREALPGAQVRPDPSLDPGTPELHVVPRRREAAALGMATDELGLTVDALIDGAVVGELTPAGETSLDVLVRAVREDGVRLEDPDALGSAPVVTPTQQIVPLAALARLSEELGPTVIRRIERRRGITLIVSPPESIPLERAMEVLETEVLTPMRSQLPAGVDVEVSGSAGDLEEARTDFAGVLLLALVLSYLLMAALFEDFLAPVVVLVTVPLAAAGGLMALRAVDAWLAPQSLDLMTAVGFLILIGVVVNNAILVVDGAIARLREGDALATAVGASVEGRVRPILMTTATSLAGLLPMVLVPGDGSELYRGVGAIVLGGLALSTVLTLVVVPCFFGLVWRVRALVAPRAPASEAASQAAE
jgi:HAE1 family hydrophobic/amphiphilic exporter-1